MAVEWRLESYNIGFQAGLARASPSLRTNAVRSKSESRERENAANNIFFVQVSIL